VTAELLAAFDRQLRARVFEPLPEGITVERDGPVLRFTGDPSRGWVLYRDLGGLEGEALDALIARQVEIFAARGEPFEWKTYAHDEPADLPERLRAAGFVPEEPETVLVGPVEAVAAEPQLPEGLEIREVTELADLRRIDELERSIYGETHHELAESLARERAADPGALRIFLVEAAGEPVCAGWLRLESGTEFASLWGGGTRPGWRGRGLYRALVVHRAQRARERGYRYLQVDASDESRPILERLGFVALTTTTPYVWSP
jgi:GNAT superfamily N-acetyltransferase